MATELQNSQIRKALKGNFLVLGSYREVRRLKDYLNPQENIIAITVGSRLGQRGRGLIVATDYRLIFMWDGWVFRDIQDFPYETVSSMKFNIKIFFGEMTVYGKGDEVTYNWVGRFSGARFIKIARQLVAESVRNPRLNPTANINNDDSAAQVVSPMETNAFIPDIDDVSVESSTADFDTEVDSLKFQKLRALEEDYKNGTVSETEYQVLKSNLLSN